MTPHTFLDEATFEEWLGTNPFLRLDNKLLFYHQETEQYVIAKLDPEGDYTANDYFQLPESASYQLINGKFILSIAPSIKHQDISSKLHTLLNMYVWENELGKVFHAPTDIKLGEKNVYQPDILYISVARKSQIGEQYIEGAPEFVIEILSPSTEGHDRTEKMDKYGEYDVVEYWIVHPKEKFIEVYYNEDKEMQLVQTAKVGDSISSKAIEGFVLDLSRVF